MKDGEKLERTIKGLRCCIDLAEPGGIEDLNCEMCPYGEGGGACRSQAPLLQDALELLRGLRKSRREESHEADLRHKGL